MKAMLEVRANELAEAANIIRSQLPYRNGIWMRSLTSRTVGGDVSELVHDVRWLENTGRRRDNTWAAPGDHTAQRRSRNTMGYQIRPRQPSSSRTGSSPPPEAEL